MRRLAVFGSALTDRFGPESDIDLLIDFLPDAQVGFLALGRMRCELEAIFGRPVDLVPQSGLKPLVRAQVLASAEPVYAP